MQHVAFHVPVDRFDAMVEHVRACGVNVIGPVPLGGRFWSACFYDPNGIRLALATSRAPAEQGVVESVLQTAQEARAELATLFDDAHTVDAWLARMPLREAAPAQVRGRRSLYRIAAQAFKTVAFKAVVTPPGGEPG